MNPDPSVPYLTDIPLPVCLRRQVEQPHYALTHETGLNRILGFRIEVKGRRGSRSMKSGLSYGRLDRSAAGSSHVDFAKSFFVSKRGISGVKVWINYGK